MKLGVRVQHRPRKSLFNLGADPKQRADTHIILHFAVSGIGLRAGPSFLPETAALGEWDRLWMKRGSCVVATTKQLIREIKSYFLTLPWQLCSKAQIHMPTPPHNPASRCHTAGFCVDSDDVHIKHTHICRAVCTHDVQRRETVKEPDCSIFAWYFYLHIIDLHIRD